MGTRETYQKTLMHACLVAGGEAALAQRLHVPMHSLVDWLLGDVPVPNEVFLRVVDVVVASNRAHVQDTRALLAAIRKRHRRD